jgi:hypothetical protein
MTAPAYHWGGDPHGLQLGVWITPSQIAAGGVVQVRAAIHNGSARPLAIESRFSLIVQRGDLLVVHVSGPSSSEPLEVAPGTVLEPVAWQLDVDQFGALPGRRVLWVTYRPSTGSELRSGEAHLEVRA